MYGLYPGNVISAKRTPAMGGCLQGRSGTAGRRRHRILTRMENGPLGQVVRWPAGLQDIQGLYQGTGLSAAFCQMFHSATGGRHFWCDSGDHRDADAIARRSHRSAACPAQCLEPRALSMVFVRGEPLNWSMQWTGGRITRVEVLSKKGQTCRINPKTKVQSYR